MKAQFVRKLSLWAVSAVGLAGLVYAVSAVSIAKPVYASSCDCAEAYGDANEYCESVGEGEVSPSGFYCSPNWTVTFFYCTGGPGQHGLPCSY
jgi:hypothetical protein